jgi:erythritol transport system ATP-binding protein
MNLLPRSATLKWTYLFRVIRELKASGVSIIYISHKLDELLRIGDYITVLRDGRNVAEETFRIDVPWIIEKMVGKNPAALFLRKEHIIGETLLRVENLTLPRIGGGYIVDHVSFDLHAGEILGFYGLMGAGRSDLVDCLAGASNHTDGTIWLQGAEIKSNTVSDRIQKDLSWCRKTASATDWYPRFRFRTI